MQNRLKSPILWLAIASFVAFITKTYFNYEIPEFDVAVDMLLGILTMLGVLNNPTNKESF